MSPSSPAWNEATYWSLDLETDGLVARRDQILSVGMAPVRRGVIRWGEAFYTTVRPLRPVSRESLAIHHLTPQELEAAPDWAEVLPEIERRLAEAVLLVHHAPLDLAFLNVACRRQGCSWPRRPVVDTHRLLLKLIRRRRVYHPEAEAIPLQLARACAHFGLPDHRWHHALSDALATAELFLALVHQLGARRLRDLQ